MNIVILSRNRNLYSTKRLVEEAEDRGHFVEVIDPLNCDLIIEKEKPTIYSEKPPKPPNTQISLRLFDMF